jgi:hypothetical protein
MKIVVNTLSFLMVATTWPSLLVAADAPPTLTHNPFSRPSSEVVRIERGVIESDDGSAPELPLHATMVGRVSRLANVAGRILKPGDEYRGYQLVAIHERYAVFERGGQTTTVYVKPEQEEEDDE